MYRCFNVFHFWNEHIGVRGIALALLACYTGTCAAGVKHGSSKERNRLIKKLLQLGPHRLQRICEGEGVDFLVQNEAGENVRVGVCEMGEDEGEYVRVVEEKVVRDVRKELRGELKRMMDLEVRQEVRGELKREVREELKRNGGHVGLVAEAIRDIKEDVRRKVELGLKLAVMGDVDRKRKEREREIKRKMEARIIELEKKSEEKKPEECTEDESEYSGGQGSEKVMKSERATQSVIATTRLR
ncbi:hypothetical protein MFRU_020g00720 [Monilinia fructicola]|uniref:Uncharacterized protein n=1 Tax=Monilinia fructicola TaxID=38448 RepID=A0A5M9K439_MONFR|nr:hypothetical protein EYC84_004806 [Monilinia fructicola]KAG4028633.1 hypothetical protein MFRU_020g00720 [Monilinia fructicola]